MRLLAFLFRADRRQHVAGAVHAGVGLGRDIGPMRLDVGQMQAPRTPVRFRFRDEIHRAAGHVGRLGMLVGNARGLVGMNQQPAVLQACRRRFAGIGPMLPRVGRVVSAFAQICVVARTGPAGRMQSVVALIGLEAAFGDMHADDRVRRDAERASAFEVGRHVGLADQHIAHADFLQMIAQASARRPAAASRSSASRASACSGRYRTTSATGRRSAIAHRRSRSARRASPWRRCSASSGSDVRCSPGNHGEAGRT